MNELEFIDDPNIFLNELEGSFLARRGDDSQWLSLALTVSTKSSRSFRKGDIKNSQLWAHCGVSIYDLLSGRIKYKGSKESLILSSVRERIKCLNKYGQSFIYATEYRGYINDWFNRLCDEASVPVKQLDNQNAASFSHEDLFRLRRLKNAVKAIGLLDYIQGPLIETYNRHKRLVDLMP